MYLAGAVLTVITAATRGLRTAVLSTLSGVVLLGAEVLKQVLLSPGFSVQMLANSFPSGHVAAVVRLSWRHYSPPRRAAGGGQR